MLGILLAAAGVVAALLALVYWRQEALLFQPERLPADYAFALPQVEEVSIAVDGASLSGLHLQLPQPKGLVFYLHGNAGSLASWFVDTDFYRQANFDLFMFDYRGYGKSTGSIRSEAQLRADVRAAWRRIAPRYRGLRKVILGRSLGTALAAGLAAEVRPDLAILVSAYWSMDEMRRLHYPYLPAWLLRYPLKTSEDVARIDGRVLLVHGELDDLIPPRHSALLQKRARDARVQLISGAGHNDLQDSDAYRKVIAAALAGS